MWRQITRGVRNLANRERADNELADEVQHYLDQTTDAFIATGMRPEEARRAAILEIGNTTVVREQLRAYGWENLVSTSVADLRFAARRLRSTPGFTVVAVLTLALGLGASTAIFSAVNPILFQPLPYPQAQRIVSIWDFGVDGGRLDVTFGTFRELLARNRSFEALAVMRAFQPTLVGATQPERLNGQRVTADYFRVLGVSPLIGQDFQALDDRRNGPNVVILSDGLWRRRFGGDPAIVGKAIVLNDASYSVAGVMPPAFENVLSPDAEIWALLQYDQTLPQDGREWGHHLRMVGRLRPGIGADRAKGELDTIARTPVPEFSRARWAALRNGFTVNPLQDDVTRAVKPALIAILGSVVLLLVIACVNVTNLLLARGAQRQGEFAMRAALGAGRGRIIRQLLTESLLLAALGGALGMAVAEIGVRALVAVSPAALPRIDAIRFNGVVFLFGVALTTIVGLIFGAIPAIHASRADVHAGIQRGSARSTGGHPLTRRALVVAEVALALVLLVSAGLLFRSLSRLFAVDPGFNPTSVLTMQVQTSGRRYADDRAVHQFFEQALAAVKRVPGVTSAGFTGMLPLTSDNEKYGVHFESIPIDPNEDGSALRYAITPGYLETMRIPIRRGRPIDDHDIAGRPVAVLINESFANRKFRGQDPIGQRMHLGSTDQPWYTIVGVVGDVKQTSLALAQADEVYVPTVQWYAADRVLSLVVRAQGDTGPLINAIHGAIWSVDKDLPIVRVATMESLVAASAAERRFALILFETFALVALVLAATGIYGVLSGSVTQRMREIGVRAALGASRADILALIMGQGMGLTAVGVAIGLTGAAAASQALVTLLFGVSRLDLVTHAAVIALLAGVSAIACGVPAWRAARIDPSLTLRAE